MHLNEKIYGLMRLVNANRLFFRAYAIAGTPKLRQAMACSVVVPS